MLQIIYHGIPSFYPVSASLYTNGVLTSPIKRGQLVGLNASGEAVPYDVSVAEQYPIGIAGDNATTLSAGQFTNRLSDMGNQTFASGFITVYSGGGDYYVDINANGGDSNFPMGDVVVDGTVAIGDRLAPASIPGKLTVNANALPQSTTPVNQLIARVTDDLATSGYKLPTGIPNENEPSGDSDNPRKFARIKLLI